MKFSIISVDYQNDFCTKGGKYYLERPCQTFIEQVFVPCLKRKGIKIAEIVCDYRLPRPHETEAWCVPGEWGFLSAIDASVKLPNVWVKGQHSPEWVREHGGDASKKPGLPYQDPAAFTTWLKNTIGSPKEAGDVILIGLTLDCCVLQTAQQLHFRGYNVSILKEGSDIYDVNLVAQWLKNAADYKDILFNTTHWTCALPMTWEAFKTRFLSGKE